MRKRFLIFPLVMVVCMLTAAGVALLSPPTEAEAEPIVKKQAEKIMKNPVTVAEMESRNKKEESCNIEVTEAVIATITPTPTPSPTPEITPTPEPAVAEEPPLITEEAVLVMEEPFLVTEVVNDQEEPPAVDSCFEGHVETGNYYEDIPDETSLVYQTDDTGDMQYYSTMTVTFYTREEIGYDAPGASGLGCVPGMTCAMPDMSLMGRTVYIEGFGTYLVTDQSPSGIADIYLESNAQIPSCGMATASVYLVG